MECFVSPAFRFFAAGSVLPRNCKPAWPATASCLGTRRDCYSFFLPKTISITSAILRYAPPNMAGHLLYEFLGVLRHVHRFKTATCQLQAWKPQPEAAAIRSPLVLPPWLVGSPHVSLSNKYPQELIWSLFEDNEQIEPEQRLFFHLLKPIAIHFF